jgi:hypothetical protein
MVVRRRITELVGFACLALLAGCGEATQEPAGDSPAAAGVGNATAGSGPVAGTGGGTTAVGGGGAGTGGESPGGGAGSAGSSGSSGENGGSGGSTGGSAGAGAGSSGQSGEAGSGGVPPEPGTREAERAALDGELRALADLDATKLRERYPVAFEQAPTYTASEITGLDLIQASALALTDAEQAALLEKGFVISANRAFPTFQYGYASVYGADLPVYVSADSILEAVHRSYDRVLAVLESQSLMAELTALLDGMRARLAGGVGTELDAAVRADADTFLTVAASLLAGQALEPAAGGSAADVAALLSLADTASGVANISLFGVTRENEDFSQFKPRGHYTDTPELGRYFKAMMWLGRIDFRLIETQSDGSRVFQRRQLEGTLLMNALIDDALRSNFDKVDNAIRLFVGEPDYMELSEVGSLLADVGVTSLAGVAAVSDQAFEQAILEGGYGLQRISSHIMINGMSEPGTLPLSLSFALLGQRYVIDSHVFSNVVYDRAGAGTISRMMPNPLDAAFAVLQNDQAGALLAPELERYPYAPDLAAMRVLADYHPSEFWTGTLYNLWLGALRELSPGAIAKSADADALTPTFRSEQWGRRLLTTQLASWAELRHDTLLYAKQAYTGGSQCEFPDGYVDPYPEFYAKLAEYAARGKEAFGSIPAPNTFTTSLGAYFDNLLTVANRLRDMATHQRTGAPYTQEMLDFLNEAVFVNRGCGDPIPGGWYSKLFFSLGDAILWAPTIADVHTQPTDEVGNPVGKVLHVGTGDARLMVVVAETCSGPRAYAGVASSYQELVTSNFERLDDPTWETLVRDQPDVPWVADIVTR